MPRKVHGGARQQHAQPSVLDALRSYDEDDTVSAVAASSAEGDSASTGSSLHHTDTDSDFFVMSKLDESDLGDDSDASIDVEELREKFRKTSAERAKERRLEEEQAERQRQRAERRRSRVEARAREKRKGWKSKKQRKGSGVEGARRGSRRRSTRASVSSMASSKSQSHMGTASSSGGLSPRSARSSDRRSSLARSKKNSNAGASQTVGRAGSRAGSVAGSIAGRSRTGGGGSLHDIDWEAEGMSPPTSPRPDAAKELIEAEVKSESKVLRDRERRKDVLLRMRTMQRDGTLPTGVWTQKLAREQMEKRQAAARRKAAQAAKAGGTVDEPPPMKRAESLRATKGPLMALMEDEATPEALDAVLMDFDTDALTGAARRLNGAGRKFVKDPRSVAAAALAQKQLSLASMGRLLRGAPADDTEDLVVSPDGERPATTLARVFHPGDRDFRKHKSRDFEALVQRFGKKAAVYEDDEWRNRDLKKLLLATEDEARALNQYDRTQVLHNFRQYGRPTRVAQPSEAELIRREAEDRIVARVTHEYETAAQAEAARRGQQSLENMAKGFGATSAMTAEDVEAASKKAALTAAAKESKRRMTARERKIAARQAARRARFPPPPKIELRADEAARLAREALAKAEKFELPKSPPRASTANAALRGRATPIVMGRSTRGHRRTASSTKKSRQKSHGRTGSTGTSAAMNAAMHVRKMGTYMVGRAGFTHRAEMDDRLRKRTHDAKQRYVEFTGNVKQFFSGSLPPPMYDGADKLDFHPMLSPVIARASRGRQASERNFLTIDPGPRQHSPADADGEFGSTDSGSVLSFGDGDDNKSRFQLSPDFHLSGPVTLGNRSASGRLPGLKFDSAASTGFSDAASVGSVASLTPTAAEQDVSAPLPVTPNNAAGKLAKRRRGLSQTPRGEFERSKADYYSTLRDSHTPSKPIDDGAKRVHIAMCEELGLVPEPVGVVRKGDGTINLKGYRLGDQFAEILAATGEYMEPLTSLNLRENRLSRRGAARVLSTLASSSLTHLDLSSNNLGGEGCQALVRIIESAPLELLNLESTGITDRSMVLLAKALRKCGALTRLILRRNSITRSGSAALGALLAWQSGRTTEASPPVLPQEVSAAIEAVRSENTSSSSQWPKPGETLPHPVVPDTETFYGRGIKELDFAWNGLSGDGARLFFEQLQYCTKLKTLDVSWNAIGGTASGDGRVALAHWLATNTSVTHLDISANAFSAGDIKVLEPALRLNRSIRGLHCARNAFRVNGRGFFELIDQHFTVDDGHSQRENHLREADASIGHTQKRIVSTSTEEEPWVRKVNTGSDDGVELPADNCWVCGRWRPWCFEWRPPVSGPIADRVSLCLEFEDFEPDPMHPREDGLFQLYRMVPQESFRFMFLVDGVKRAAMDELYEHFDVSKIPSDAIKQGTTLGKDGYLFPDGFVNYVGTDQAERDRVNKMINKRNLQRRLRAAAALMHVSQIGLTKSEARAAARARVVELKKERAAKRLKKKEAERERQKLGLKKPDDESSDDEPLPDESELVSTDDSDDTVEHQVLSPAERRAKQMEEARMREETGVDAVRRKKLWRLARKRVKEEAELAKEAETEKNRARTAADHEVKKAGFKGLDTEEAQTVLVAVRGTRSMRALGSLLIRQQSFIAAAQKGMPQSDADSPPVHTSPTLGKSRKTLKQALQSVKSSTPKADREGHERLALLSDSPMPLRREASFADSRTADKIVGFKTRGSMMLKSSVPEDSVPSTPSPLALGGAGGGIFELVKIVDMARQQQSKLLGNRLVHVAKRKPVPVTILPRQPPLVYPEDEDAEEAVTVRPPWSFDRSVFAKYNHESEAQANKAFQADWRLSKVGNIIKDKKQMEDVADAIRPHYKRLRNVFKQYACRGTMADPFSIQLNSFTEFCVDAKLPDDSTCKISDLDYIFVACNVAEKRHSYQTNNRAHSLCRYEFCEAIVRLAVAKFVRPGTIPDVAEATRVLVEKHIIPHCKYAHDEWRDERLYNEASDLAFKRYIPELKQVFKRASVRYERMGGVPRMTIYDFVTMLAKAGLFDKDFSERRAKFAFVNASESVEDETATRAHETLLFPEFLESLGRVAERRDPGDFPLALKLPPILEAIIDSTLDAYALERVARREHGQLLGGAVGAKVSSVSAVQGKMDQIRDATAASEAASRTPQPAGGAGGS